MPSPTPQIQQWKDLIRFTTPIERFEETPDGNIIVSGYCYVNANCGDGWNLKRTAMEAATPGYLAFGAIREMHRKDSAAGTALSAIWDGKGCYLRSLIVDPVAKEKVRTGVYKAYSVGVRPGIVRGKDVESCDWAENSLVDRPADKDATIDSFELNHSEGLDQPYDVQVFDAEADIDELVRAAAPLSYEALRQHEENGRTHTADYDAWDNLYEGMNRLRSALAGISGSKANNKADLMSRSIQQFSDHMTPLLCGDAPAAERALNDLQITRKQEDSLPLDLPEITRLLQEGGDAADDLRRALVGPTLERLEGIEATLAGLPGQISAAVDPLRTEVERIGKQPAPVRMPVLNPQAVERRLAGDTSQASGNSRVDELTRSYAELSTRLANEPNDSVRSTLVSQRSVIRAELRSLGVQMP